MWSVMVLFNSFLVITASADSLSGPPTGQSLSGPLEAQGCVDDEGCSEPPPLKRWALPPGSSEKVRLPVDVDGDRTFKTTVEPLGSSGVIFRVSPFLNSVEVDYMLSFKRVLIPEDSLWRRSSFVNLPGNKKGILARRVEALLSLPRESFGVSIQQMQCYPKGGHYHPHYDSARLDQLNATLPADFPGGPGVYPNAARYVTLVLYLSDGGPDVGGETYFPFEGLARERVGWDVAYAVSPQSNTTALRETAQMWTEHCRDQKQGAFVTPKKGEAIFFYNHLTTSDGRVGEMDPLSFHGSCPILRGEKCMVNIWVSVPPTQFGYPTSRHCTAHHSSTHMCRPIDAERERVLRTEFLSYVSGEAPDRDWSDLTKAGGFARLSRRQHGLRSAAEGDTEV
eukprot:Hpha_TRINITY_DN20653_c0_g1::TRINITY_DN20653_c0_g1_i1::g.148056::m.148056/K06711/PH-4; hypoxia-inducible factor prolyl 4-hydroxylase